MDRFRPNHALAADYSLHPQHRPGRAGGRLHALSPRPRLVGAGHQRRFGGALALGVVLTLIAGPLSDRGGRRPFLFVYEFAQWLAGLVAVFSAAPGMLWAAALVGGFGRGGNGAAGPFAPVEQAWLAQALTPAQRGPVYSLNSALGFLGNAAGAVIAALPSVVRGALPGALSYRPLFLLSAVGSLLCCALVLRTPDTEANLRRKHRRHRAKTVGKTGWCCG